MNFCPSPTAVPTRGVELPIADSSPCVYCTSSSTPPTMISRSPFPARTTPPDTGASTTCVVNGASLVAAAITASGPTVAITTTCASGESTSAIPSSPNSTASSCGPVATMITTASAP
ncbi:Uncharacterised protein [Mycobacteroides abscessus subsp. abscessus]|nr:Uncharacterised protein [Mycobacteroides abscessus subsp. abscessus]